jgi:hypothetical protein
MIANQALVLLCIGAVIALCFMSLYRMVSQAWRDYRRARQKTEE